MTVLNRKIALLILVVPLLVYQNMSYANSPPEFDFEWLGEFPEASVGENQPIGTEVIRLSATDPDGDSLTFGLIGAGRDKSGNKGHYAFTVEGDGNVGVVKTKVVLDYETISRYWIEVWVSDVSDDTSVLSRDTMDVKIYVTNDESDDDTNVPNRSPVFDAGESITLSIAEGLPSGTEIGSPLTATDPDGDPVSYSAGLDDSLHPTEFLVFRIWMDFDTAQLKTNAVLDYNTKSSYSVTVYASDGKGGQGSISVTINVTTDTIQEATTNDGETAIQQQQQRDDSETNQKQSKDATQNDDSETNQKRSQNPTQNDSNTDQRRSNVGQQGSEQQQQAVDQTTPPDTETPITPLRTLNKTAAPGQIGFSELMFASRGGLHSLPQWLELYNNSETDAVNLKGWQLEIEARDDNGVHRHAVITLETLLIPPNQTALIVTWVGRNSAIDLPEDRIYNFFNHHSDEFEQNEHRNQVLGFVGFSLKLLNPEGVVSDIAGNLDGDSTTEDEPAWALLTGITEDGARTSLMRRYQRETRLPFDGTITSNWVPASELNLRVMTYWGKATDIGNPGYRGEGALPVQLSGFRAARLDTDTVVVEWTTASELDNAGFNILRSQTRQGPFLKVNPTLIIGAGTTSERHEYTWRDTTVQPNTAYYYQIEDVAFSGKHQRLSTVRMKGHLSVDGKLLQKWGDLKRLE